MSKDNIIMLTKLGYLAYEVCELVYKTSNHLKARLVLSTQCLMMVKTYVIACYRGESVCCFVQLLSVVPENLRMRHCVDKTTCGFDIITYRLDKLLLGKGPKL